MKRLTMIAALLGASWVLALTIIGGALSPGYEHASQFISELGAKGAPNAQAINYAGFLPAGILITSFAFLAWLALPRSLPMSLGMLGIALFALGYLVAAFYPCDAGCRPQEPSIEQTIHNFFGLAGYVTAPLTLFLLAWSARKWPQGGALALLGALLGTSALAALVSLSPDFAYVGAAQRALEASVLLWVVACGLYIGRQPNSTA